MTEREEVIMEIERETDMDRIDNDWSSLSLASLKALRDHVMSCIMDDMDW